MDIPLNKAARTTATNLKTIASDEIREELNLTKTRVDKDLKTFIKWANQNEKTVEVTVYSHKRGALLHNFKKGKVVKGKGVVLEIKEGNKKRIKGAFSVRLKNGVETVMWRREKGGGRKINNDTFAMYAPSASQVMNTKRDIIAERGGERWRKNIEHEIKRHLDGK